MPQRSRHEPCQRWFQGVSGRITTLLIALRPSRHGVVLEAAGSE